MGEPGTTINVRKVGAITVLEITEPRIFEGSSFAAIRRDLLEAVGPPAGRRFVLDFKAVELMSSEMLGLLITVYRDVSESGGRLVLAGVRPVVLKVFQVTRLDQLFRIESDVEQAVAVANR